MRKYGRVSVSQLSRPVPVRTAFHRVVPAGVRARLGGRPEGGALAVAALGAVVLSIPGGNLQGIEGPGRLPEWPVVAVTAVVCAGLVMLRRRPRAAAVLATAGAVALAAAGYLMTSMLLAPLVVAMFRLTVRAGARAAAPCAGGAALLLAAVGLAAAPPGRDAEVAFLGPVFCMLATVGFGSWVRLRADYLRILQARAEQAERDREQEARRRVAEERTRIARELHDVVAHHLALAHAQAGTARHLLHSRPDQVEDLLASLTRTTSSALRDLKATVGLLRQPQDVPDPDDAPPEPAPGLAQLPGLTGSFAAAGLVVSVEVDGERRPLSPAVDLTAYRIVQEALTNVTRHSGARSARVRLAYRPDGLRITVTDPGGPGPATAREDGTGGGFGLIGLRERAHSVGGRLHAAPLPAGGFEVRAELPLRPCPPGTSALPAAPAVSAVPGVSAAPGVPR